MPSKRKYPCRDKNQLLGFSVPIEMRLWFLDYLQKFTGESGSQQFRNMLYLLYTFEKQGRDPFGEPYKESIRMWASEMKKNYGVEESTNLCIRSLEIFKKENNNQDRVFACQNCQDSPKTHSQYIACKSARADFEKELSEKRKNQSDLSCINH